MVKNEQSEFLVSDDLCVDKAKSIITLRDGEEHYTVMVEPQEMKQLLNWIAGSLDDIRAEPEQYAPAESGWDNPADEDCPPAWKLRVSYVSGQKLCLRGDGIKLPVPVGKVYWKLTDYFMDVEAGDLDFLQSALACGNLIELNQLICELVTDADETGDSETLGSAYMDILSFRDRVVDEDCSKKRDYHIHSGAAANLCFLSSFLPARHSAQEKLVQTGRERLAAFDRYAREYFIPPVGPIISVAEIDMVMNAVCKRYPLFRKVLRDNKLTILRLSNTHKAMNSLCNAAHHRNNAEKFHYELCLFHTNGAMQGHPVYIFLHELGHILQVEATHDPALVPESFITFSDGMTEEKLTQGQLAPELFADAFAMAMMQTFDWKEYDSFDTVPDMAKTLFKNYMDLLMMRMETQEIKK